MKIETTGYPNTWTKKNWPRDVYPFDGARARHLLRIYQSELLAAGALTRIGKELVVLGAGYGKWLASNANRVTEFDVPANREEHQHKRFGGTSAQE